MSYNQYKQKYEKVEKVCPVCGNMFITSKGHKKEKITCSHGCSNTFFATKRNYPSRYKRYQTICFKKWDKKCLLCSYDRIVSVHHLDGNNKNNDISNLVPLCMNCHGEVHHKVFQAEALEKLHSILRGVG